MTVYLTKSLPIYHTYTHVSGSGQPYGFVLNEKEMAEPRFQAGFVLNEKDMAESRFQAGFVLCYVNRGKWMGGPFDETHLTKMHRYRVSQPNWMCSRKEIEKSTTGNE